METVERPLVVIPTYNERENISRVVPAVLEADSRLHVLIVDDASPDETARAVMKLKNTRGGRRLFLKSRPGKLGLGSAYVQGLKWGLAKGYGFFIQMDADGSHDPGYLKTMLRLAETTDFVVGSRYISGGKTRNWTAGRRLLSKSASFYSNLILGADFADFTGGFNGWSREVLEMVGLDAIRSEGYSFQIELKYRAHQMGYRHKEFPIVFTERKAGRSKMSLSIVMEACWRVWQLKLRNGIGSREGASVYNLAGSAATDSACGSSRVPEL